jgi:tetratricopeptide (TPR) repeat protein
MFFGREDVFSWIERSLTGKYVDHILVLHGQRRVGKTSVLKQIPNFLPDKYIQVFFDLQGRTGTTLDRFLWWIASEIVRTIKREIGISLPKPDLTTFADIEYLINEFLPSLQPILGEKVVLLTFDEFDTLDRPEIQQVLARPLIAYLRRLMEMDGLSFIFSIGSSGDKLENMQASYTDFFKSALYRKISFLTRDDCHRLITKPVEGVIEYEKEAVDQIVKISSGHPYFTQLMCHELFSRCQKTGIREISGKDVEAVLEDVVERGTVNLKFVWDEASDLEKWILAALAQMDGSSDQELTQTLEAQGVHFSDSNLNSSLIHLQDKDVLTKDNRFVIHLMRMWLVANRPMDRVREELVEVNPIADRFIEIGDEYRNRGQNQAAIENYQQALNDDEGNLKAQTRIGTIYLEQGDYSEAVTAFETAMKIDEEDVVARSGYCDAVLALGEAAQSGGKSDEALDMYQAILVVNPAHTDARKRMAAIFQEQAEALLVEGRDDEALIFFNQAMTSTPEDDQLSARYDEVLAEVKSKVINTWLSKAEKALSRQGWDEAAEMVEEAIKVDPDDQNLQVKLIEVKDAPRQFKLRGYRREAEQAANHGNWDDAVQAWESYLALEPDGGDDIGDKLQFARKYARIAGDYVEAQQAIRAKRYGRAIELLQGIIAQEPSYKLTTRLLVEAVEANKAIPLWKRRWVLPAVGIVVIIVLGITFGPQAWNAVSSAIANRSVTVTEVPITGDATSVPEIDVIETPTLEPAIQAALDAIQNEAPLYQTSFDSWDFGDPVENARVEDGKLIVTSEGEYTGVIPYNLRSGKFAVEFEFLILESGSNGHCVFGTDNEEFFDETKRAISAEFTWNGLAELSRYVYLLDVHEPIPEGKSTFDISKSNTVTVIILGDQITAFINGQIAYTAFDPDGSVIYSHQNLGANSTIECEFDNYKLWDLSGMQFSDTIPTPTLDPAIQAALDAIQNEAPLYQTSFNSWDFGDPVENVSLEDGKLIVTSEGEHVAVDLSNLSSDRFAVEFEFLMLESGSQGECNFTTENVNSGRGLVTGFFSSGDVDLVRNVSPGQQENLANSTFEVSKSNVVTLFILGKKITAFINGQMAYSALDVYGSTVYNRQSLAATNECVCEFDYYKFWDLSEGEITAQETPTPTPTPTEETSAYYEPILTYLDSHSPTFEDDFSAADMVWGRTSEMLPIDNLVYGGKLTAIDHTEQPGGGVPNDHAVPGLTFPTNGLFRASNFELQFDFSFPSFHPVVKIGVQFRSPYQQNTGYEIFFSRSGEWDLTFNDGTTLIANGEWNRFGSAGGYNKLRLIAQDQYLAIFLDGELIYEFNDLESPGNINQITLMGDDNGGSGEFDNVKFWNLDGVEISE